ncbi:hypothetical protein F5H01DRAFT_325556 [Linnemannia elongata]|nr:hypothetical protein F5H01DRAFT_325556 [Linnemannia elongata]
MTSHSQPSTTAKASIPPTRSSPSLNSPNELRLKTIVACARVNKAWHSIWLPIIWHTIDAGMQWRNQGFLSALHQHADLIRNLKCARYDDIRLLFDSSASSSPTLESSLSGQTSSGLESGPSTVEQRRRPTKRVSLDENKTLEAKTLETLLSKLNPTLQGLSLKSTFFIKHPFGSGEEFAASADNAKKSYGIQSLCMDGVACSQDFLLHLASRFPSLTHFSLGDSAEVYIDDKFGENMARLCPQLKSIDISFLDNMDDESIAGLIRALPRLQKFRAAETMFGDKSLEALVEDGRDLSILDINTTYITHSSGVQRLLERSGALTKLDAWELSVNVPEMTSEAYGTRVSSTESRTAREEDSIVASATALHSRAFTLTPGGLSGERTRDVWGCTGLESLVLGVDYSTDDLTEQECKLYPPSKARHFIYQQISRLTNLRYLTVGGAVLGGNDEDSFQEDEGAEEDERNCGGIEVDAVDSEDQDDDDDEDDEDWTPSTDKSSVAKLQKKMAKLEVIDQDSNSLWIEFSLRSGLAILAPIKDFVAYLSTKALTPSVSVRSSGCARIGPV